MVSFNLFKFKKKEQIKETKLIFKVESPKDAPSLPDLKEKSTFNVKYPLITPFAYTNLFWDKTNNELVYSVEEPKLDESEKRILSMLEEGVRELINISFINIKEESKVIEYLEKNIHILLKEFGIKISQDTFLKLMYYIYRDFIGLNEIEPLLRDYFIEDIECNGVNTPVYIVHRKYRNLRTNIVFKDSKKLANLVEKLAQRCGKYVSYANPIFDGRLPTGERVNATYTQDITSRGPTFSIRKFVKEPWTPIKLIDFRTLSPEILAYLWLLIEYESNIMIIGGTGSGKTSFLNGIAFFIPPQARVISIEDTKELNLLHENWLPSVAREGTSTSSAKQSEVTMFDLLKESFRQRPDYVIVGEIRGAEAFVVFQGMSSGHPSFATMHAEDVATMIKRLETPPINLSPTLVESIDAVCIMTNARIRKENVRRLREISEIVNVGARGFKSNSPFVWDPRQDKFFFKTDSVIFNRIAVKYGITTEQLMKEFNVRTKLLWKMYQRKIFGFKEVQDTINLYYRSPEEVLKKFGII